MCRSLFVTGAFCVLAANATSAADFPVRGAIPAAGIACPAQAFNGWYAGVSGGGTVWTADRNDQDAFTGESAGYVQKRSGPVGGGQIGYNMARCNTHVTTRLNPNLFGVDQSITSGFNGLIAGTFRTGVVLDNVMFYLSGGTAVARFNTTYFSAAVPFTATTSINEWRWGWAAGFGADVLLSDRISLRSELLYVEFPDKEYRQQVTPLAGVPPLAFANFTHSDAAMVTKIGLNVQLGPVTSSRR
jgi:opacity protein-like surface antigen